MEKGHGEEEGKEVANERSADLMRWCVFSIALSSIPVQGVWMGLWNQTSLQSVTKKYGGKGEMYGECTTAQVSMPGATMELKFH